MTQHYTGTKIVEAWPQVKIQGEDVRDGYAVKYADGFTSWSPKDVFEQAYLPIGHIGHLPTHLQRMYGEQADLDSRLTKLNDFLKSEKFNVLPERERYLLEVQGRAMTAYFNALASRISHANPVPTAQATAVEHHQV